MIRLLLLLVVLVGLAAIIETGRSRDAAPPAGAAAPDRAEATRDPTERSDPLGEAGGGIGGITGAALARAEAEAMAALAREGAPMLAAWIHRTRAAVLAAGTRPIPPDIRASLAKHYPPDLLKPVRYRVGWSDPDTLPGRLFEAYAQAITLDDVIIFRNEAVARDEVIWAHEIAHVDQYRRWGIDEFARRYVADHRAVEREAWQATDAWARRQGDPAPGDRAASR
jgi:hypothetical protein